MARACTFSRTLCQVRVITSSFDLFTGLSPSFLIGQSNYFGFGFTTLDWNSITEIMHDLSQEPKIRSVQLHCICGTAFLQTELFLDWFSHETRSFQLITCLAWEFIAHWIENGHSCKPRPKDPGKFDFVGWCWTMLTAGAGQTVSRHHQQSSRKALYSVPGCSRGCHYGYGHGYVIERRISAQAHTQQCWKWGANSYNFISTFTTTKGMLNGCWSKV